MDNPAVASLIDPLYTIQKVLGEGAFGTVYKALEKSDWKVVALKVIDKVKLIHKQRNPRLKQLKLRYLETEGETMLKCNSDHLLKCYKILEDDKVKVMVLEFCDGGSLFEKIENEGKISEKECIKILDELLRGFGELHRNKIVHRDLKTENILIHNNVYKIADFGLAKTVDKLSLMMKGTSVGTRCTMAPEVLQGEDYNFQADIWSLGVILFEMLTGRLPFNGFITEQEIDKVNKSLEDEADISGDFKELLRDIFKVSPEQRLNWVNLYRMKNDFKGPFSVLDENRNEREMSQIEAEEIYQTDDPKLCGQNSFLIKDPSANLTQPPIESNQAIEKIQIHCPNPSMIEQISEDESTIQSSLIVKIHLSRDKFESDMKSLELTYQKIKIIIQQILKQFWKSNRVDIKAKCPSILKNQFLQLIVCQCIKLIEEHNDYLDLGEGFKPGKYSTVRKINSRVQEMNQQGKKMYDMKSRLLDHNQELNQGLRKKMKRKINEFKQSVVTDNELLEYIFYTCTQDEHIRKTKQLFDKMYEPKTSWSCCEAEEEVQNENFKKYYKPTIKAQSMDQLKVRQRSVSGISSVMSLHG